MRFTLTILADNRRRVSMMEEGLIGKGAEMIGV
jgi:hypothetical protein